MTSKPNRREVVKYISAATGVAVLGCGGSSTGANGPDASTPPDATSADASPCPATGEQTAGPFYPGEPALRMNIVGDRSGVSLALDLRIIRAGSCEEVADAEVDVWSADAAGEYSGYADFGTEGEDWLRGQQVTDAQGMAMFDCIVPGSYPGRAIHLHVKVRAAGSPELTTQVYLPDNIIAQVLAQPGYTGAAQTENDDDAFYAGDTLLTVSGDLQTGFSASGTLVIG